MFMIDGPVLLLLLLLLSLLGWRCDAQNVPTYRFLTRPDIVAPLLTISTIDPATVSNGSIFAVPRPNIREHNFTEAMYIYNNGGGLVWSGESFNIRDHIPRNFGPCVYDNSPSLCVLFFQGPQSHLSRSKTSHVLIIDQHYRPVRTIGAKATYAEEELQVDFHELKLVGTGSSVLMTSYTTVKRPTKVPDCPGSPEVSYISVSHFLETATDGSNTTLFLWSSLDHVPVSDTAVCPGDRMAGLGISNGTAFDYFHVNSVDKDEHGDYLISARFTSTIYKIAGLKSPTGQPPGEIIWQLGGKYNDFEMQTQLDKVEAFNFSFQHDARLHNGNITMWNNAMRPGGVSTAATSSAMEIEIDEDGKTATLVWQASSPSLSLSESQGNLQILSNGNRFCSVGDSPKIFEITADGRVAFDAKVGEEPMQIYRAFRGDWVGHPAESEFQLFVYAWDCTASTVFYTSWNGATEVYEYRFYAANSTVAAFQHVATARKDSNFETTATSSGFALYSYAVALSVNGEELGRTPRTRTFVPSGDLVSKCSSMHCGYDANYDTEPQTVCIIEDRFDGW